MLRRTDALRHWHARNVISEAEYRAGCRIRDTFDRAELAKVAMMRMDRPQTDREFRDARHAEVVVSAREAIVRMRWILGEIDTKILLGVIGEGHSLQEIASRWGLKGGKENAANRIRFALTMLAVKRWGLADEMAEPVPKSLIA